jgi:hypothetical protein
MPVLALPPSELIPDALTVRRALDRVEAERRQLRRLLRLSLAREAELVELALADADWKEVPTRG